MEVVVHCLENLVLHGSGGSRVHEPGAAVALAGAAGVDLVVEGGVVDVDVDGVDADYGP